MGMPRLYIEIVVVSCRTACYTRRNQAGHVPGSLAVWSAATKTLMVPQHWMRHVHRFQSLDFRLAQLDRQRRHGIFKMVWL
jgi:hypothetical protein